MEEHRIPVDGRTMAVAEYGDPEGRPVLLLPAAPGSRAMEPDPDATRAAGIRLLVVDRAGYGESTPYAADVVPTWSRVADDVAAVIAALELDDVIATGWSNGGIGALALAALHAERVRAAVVISAPAPHEEVPWVAAEFWPVLQALRAAPESAVSALSIALQPIASDLTVAVQGFGEHPADARDLVGPVRERVTRMVAEAFRHGPAGLAADITATNVVPWGFDLADVRVPVQLFYGEADETITPEHGRYYNAHLADAHLELVPGAGHLLPFTHWAQILASVAE